MKFQKFTCPETGMTWLEPVSEPQDYAPKPITPEQQAIHDDLLERTKALTAEIKAALDDINAKKEANADA
ncbi:hypothetical protein CcrColossus_gp374 [Caulobacter phage CcrColossus]|uniref:Uncharacterized protein n=1 Tax=Caulobacter phage CcrColossus TaxID=1211640 RepID=K4JSB6_9CAUD|nr:hypothetical protein CcrColossus_gp374 [Caulobacter phage CcrColossus]AFU88244.1 hypothetical protein CcrColossus_gp374 [Caulobacter phage CcrColossus]